MRGVYFTTQHKNTTTYQYINTLGAKSTVELWKEYIPKKLDVVMSKADFYAAIKAGKSFVIIVDSIKSL